MNIASRCPPFTTHLYSHCTRTRNYVDEQELTQIELLTNLMCTLTFLILNQLQNIVLYFFPFPFLFSFVSPVPEMRAEVGSFPGIILHPPLPSLMHPQDPSAKPHQQSSQAELDTHLTSAEASPSALSSSTIGPPPPLLLQPTPPYEHTVDTDSQTSKIQDSTAQLSTVFSV